VVVVVKRRPSYSRRRTAKRRAPAKKSFKRKAKKVDRSIANSKRFAKFLFEKAEEEEGKE